MGTTCFARFDPMCLFGNEGKAVGFPPGAGGFAVNLHMVDCRERADECRRLAKLRAESQHWAAFLEMAETWDHFGKLQEQSRRLKHSRRPCCALRMRYEIWSSPPKF